MFVHKSHHTPELSEVNRHERPAIQNIRRKIFPQWCYYHLVHWWRHLQRPHQETYGKTECSNQDERCRNKLQCLHSVYTTDVQVQVNLKPQVADGVTWWVTSDYNTLVLYLSTQKTRAMRPIIVTGNQLPCPNFARRWTIDWTINFW